MNLMEARPGHMYDGDSLRHCVHSEKNIIGIIT
jgi:hypothetical protein